MFSPLCLLADHLLCPMGRLPSGLHSPYKHGSIPPPHSIQPWLVAQGWILASLHWMVSVMQRSARGAWIVVCAMVLDPLNVIVALDCLALTSWAAQSFFPFYLPSASICSSHEVLHNTGLIQQSLWRLREIRCGSEAKRCLALISNP